MGVTILVTMRVTSRVVVDGRNAIHDARRVNVTPAAGVPIPNATHAGVVPAPRIAKSIADASTMAVPIIWPTTTRTKRNSKG